MIIGLEGHPNNPTSPAGSPARLGPSAPGPRPASLSGDHQPSALYEVDLPSCGGWLACLGNHGPGVPHPFDFAQGRLFRVLCERVGGLSQNFGSTS